MEDYAVGDKIKVWVDEWRHGYVHSFLNDGSHKLMLIRTDKKINNEPDAFLDGYGIEIYEWHNNPFLLRENEQEPDLNPLEILSDEFEALADKFSNSAKRKF
mgnify:CR=1 FL=1